VTDERPTDEELTPQDAAEATGAADGTGEAGADEAPAQPGPRPGRHAAERPADELDAEELDAEEQDAAEPTPEQDELTVTKMELAERTSDLQRLQAEFVNYKRRVERDRDLVKENATYAALTPIIDVLDTIDRAREHGELEEGLRTVADQLERTVAKLGLVKFGEAGEPFDPTVHEALSHIGEDPEVEVTTCKVIARAGYRIGDRVVRAAQVLVVDPASGPTA
jgi:molecular chaperone GrpE